MKMFILFVVILVNCKQVNNKIDIVSNEKPKYVWITEFKGKEANKSRYPSSIKIYNSEKLLIKEYNLNANGTNVNDSTLFYYDTIKRLRKQVYFYKIGTVDIDYNPISILKKEVTEYIYNDSGRLLLKFIITDNELKKVEGMSKDNTGPYGFTYDVTNFNYIYNGEIVYGSGLGNDKFTVSKNGTTVDSIIKNNKNQLLKRFTCKYNMDTLIFVFRDYNNYDYLIYEKTIFEYPVDSIIRIYVKNKIIQEKKFYHLGEINKEIVSYLYDADGYYSEVISIKALQNGRKEKDTILFKREFKEVNYINW